MPETITSPQNQHLKEIRKLQRRRERDALGRFVAEGEDLIAAADAAGWPAIVRLRAAGAAPASNAAARGSDHEAWLEVEPDLLAAVSSLGSGTRCLAVYEQRYGAPAGPLCVYLHGVSDPGNVGAVVRSALAFGATSVALGPGCADPFGPKAVRASMGAVFAVALARAEDLSELPGDSVGLDAAGGEPLAAVVHDLGRAPATLLVGAERHGLPDELLAACDRVAHIPIASESLNAAMAATVALYELSKNRMAAR